MERPAVVEGALLTTRRRRLREVALSTSRPDPEVTLELTPEVTLALQARNTYACSGDVLGRTNPLRHFLYQMRVGFE